MNIEQVEFCISKITKLKKAVVGDIERNLKQNVWNVIWRIIRVARAEQYHCDVTYYYQCEVDGNMRTFSSWLHYRVIMLYSVTSGRVPPLIASLKQY